MSGTSPSLAGFSAFVYSAPQLPAGAPITTAVLPADSPWITYAYNVSVATVWQIMQCIDNTIYTLCVYNLAMDRLINYAPDQPGQTYFQMLRSSAPNGYGIYNFVPGVVTATSDESTSTSLTAPDYMKTLTLADLSSLKTPFGRTYLQFAQQLGPLWGLS